MRGGWHCEGWRGCPPAAVTGEHRLPLVSELGGVLASDDRRSGARCHPRLNARIREHFTPSFRVCMICTQRTTCLRAVTAPLKTRTDTLARLRPHRTRPREWEPLQPSRANLGVKMIHHIDNDAGCADALRSVAEELDPVQGAAAFDSVIAEMAKRDIVCLGEVRPALVGGEV